MKKTLRIMAIILLLLGGVLFLYSSVVWNRYLHDLPQSAIPQTGHIYPLNIHGIVIYQTQAERNWLWFFDRGGIVVFFMGLAAGGISEKLSA